MKPGKRRAINLVAVLVLAALGATFGASAYAESASNVLFIFDSSGSMKKKLASGETRFAAAQRSMGQALANIPPDVRVGLLLYGHRKAKDCSDIELVSPIGADDAPTIAKTIKSLKPKGETPIAESLKQAARAFAALKGQSNRIVLVTDGIEECKGDPCAAAQAVKDSGLDLTVDVIGFTLTDKQAQAVQCIADLTGGKYYDAGDVTGLSGALTQVAQTVAAPPPPSRPNLLDPKQGGQLLTAPNDVWLATNDGKPDRVTWMRSDEEGVYAFKDEQPATFDTFTVLVNGSDGGNLKDFELLVASDAPAGPFRSIGTFTTQNLKLMKTPYQEFKFAPVMARYLKVKLLSNHGGDGYIGASEFQLFGELGEGKPTAQPAAAQPAAANLLDPKQGGQLLTAPNDVWVATNDGKPDWTTWMRSEEEGVYAFKDERPATFDTFAVLVTGSGGGNLKDFELLAGDDGPGGAFRSIGTFTTQNVKLMKNPYQEFKFAPVTAHYLKVKLLSNHGGDGYIGASEFQLFGTLGEAGTPAQQAAAQPATAALNLLDPKQGGQLLTAPNDVWGATNDGKPDRVTWMRSDEEGVYAFEDERPATFDTFTVLVNGSDGGNLKDFELLVGDEGPTGPFRSVGTFTTQNLKLMKNPYQEFRFAPVTARYLKVKLLSNHGGDGYIGASEFQLFGILGEAGAPAQQAAAPSATMQQAAAQPATGAVNLLDPQQGGQLLSAPSDVWAATNDGSPADKLWMQANEEGVYAFKDDRAATFDTFAVYIGGSGPGNLKEFELLAGDDGPTGTFVSIGSFATQNLKILANPYQQFKFAPVTAHYLKVRLVSNHGGDGYIAASEFQLFGTLEP
ncbi:MAG TPA: VWA domain-containing protein [Dongiaceae bacterium]|nr:VWA domain-containing protein [Dongiaceae bacterium]